ncbi:conserved domain protein [Klebsiella sp. MS 92-3]|nr:conserved domain protein [Klebsiella sp. MS 92-3]
MFRRCTLHRRVLLYVFFYRFIIRHNDVSEESGVVIISFLVLTDTLSHHKNKNWCSLSLEYHYFVAL